MYALQSHKAWSKRRFMDVELQQRAVEYMSLERKPDLARSNVVAMPPWEKRKSLLLRRMAEREVCVLAGHGRFEHQIWPVSAACVSHGNASCAASSRALPALLL